MTNTPTPPLDTNAAFDGPNFAPFTAIGQLHVGGETFDVVGGGIASARWCLEAPCPNGGDSLSLDVGYAFSVPEPPTLLLTVASFGLLGALFGARVLRDRYAARLP